MGIQVILTAPGGCHLVIKAQIHIKAANYGVLYLAAISAPNTMATTQHVNCGEKDFLKDKFCLLLPESLKKNTLTFKMAWTEF